VRFAHSFLVHGTYPTISPALAEIARREGAWFHADAAYGGCFLFTAHGCAVMRGIEQADSVTRDPHKGLFLSYGTGSLLVKDGAALKRAHQVTAAYLPSVEDDREVVDFANMSPEFSREFRGLRVWLPFKMHDATSFRRNLEEKLESHAGQQQSCARFLGSRLWPSPNCQLVPFALPAVDWARRH
jgi:aromatic-L-amino-acid decarboxylase